jgi:hypothetical protein
MRAVKLAPPHRLVDRALAPALLFLALRVAHLALAPVVHHVLAGVRLDGARRLLGLHVCFERLAPLVEARGLLHGGCGGLAGGLVRVVGEGGVDAWAMLLGIGIEREGVPSAVASLSAVSGDDRSASATGLVAW